MRGLKKRCPRGKISEGGKINGPRGVKMGEKTV